MIAVRLGSSADHARAQPAREVERLVDRPEVDLRAVAVARRLDADLRAPGAAEGIGDPPARLAVRGMQPARLAPPRPRRPAGRSPGAVLEHADRPAVGRGVTGQAP